jgi:hypothetical protein
MIRKEQETKTIEVIKDVLCNKCGKSCRCHDNHDFVCASLSVHWGYGSTRDGEVHEAHLCESCWETITKDFTYSDLVAENQY